jgi:ABC-type antimicrobial peptide transport system permease subunit
MDFAQSQDYKKIFAFHVSIPNRIIARESSWLEFKEAFNWLSKDRYAKSIAAFANGRGGYLVFGVKNLPRELAGLQSNNFEITDEAKITGYLNSVLSPEIEYEKFTIQVNGKTVGILSVVQAKSKPVVCIKNDGELRESDIYYRYNAKSERIKYPELKDLLDRIKEEERKSWMEHLEKISKVGPVNAAILDIVGGEISGRGGTLVIDKKLVPKLRFIKEGNFQEKGKPVLKLIGDVKPVSVVVGKGGKKFVGSTDVQITDDPNAPIVRLGELEFKKKFPLDYKTLTKNLYARYKDFKSNQKYHRLRKQFMKDKKFCFTKQLDPDNPKSARKDFYSPAIYKKFDKHYNRKI